MSVHLPEPPSTFSSTDSRFEFLVCCLSVFHSFWLHRCSIKLESNRPTLQSRSLLGIGLGVQPQNCMSSVAGTRFGHLTRAARRHIPSIPASAEEQLQHNILSLVRSTLMENQETFKPKEVKGLKKVPPYWYPYTTMTKQRWIGRELLEVVSTEFRDRSMEYYVSLF